MISDKKPLSLKNLFFPIFFETFLVTLTGVIDTAMVSSIGDNAVGAVGASGTYLAVINNLLSVVSVGAAAIMSRYVGAEKQRTAKRTLRIALLFNLAVGGIFSLVFALFTKQIVTAAGTAPDLAEEAARYMRVVGSSCVLVAVNFVLSAYLRAFGKPKLTMISGMVGNGVNVALNAVFLSLGFGVVGVGLATAVSRLVTLSISAVFVIRIPVKDDVVSEPVKVSYIIRSVLGIGLPSAGESFMFTVWNSVNMTFINGMGATAVNTYAYVMQIANLLSCLVNGFSTASGILVGWSIGSGDREGAYRYPNRAFLYGVLIVLGTDAALIPLVAPILSLMTDDAAILALAPVIMAIHAVRISGQMGNCVYGGCLKTASDAKATLLIGVFIMPFYVFFGSYLLGTVLGFGLVGYWIGAALDEFTRCFLMRARWKSRKWEKQCFKN